MLTVSTDHHAKPKDGTAATCSSRILCDICHDSFLVSFLPTLVNRLRRSRCSVIGVQTFRGSFRRQCVLGVYTYVLLYSPDVALISLQVLLTTTLPFHLANSAVVT